MDKQMWIQPSGKARYSQNGWIRLYDPKPVQYTGCGIKIMMIIAWISIISASLAKVLGYI